MFYYKMGRTKRRNMKRNTKRNTKRYTKRYTKRNTKRNTKRRYTKLRYKMGGSSSGFTVGNTEKVSSFNATTEEEAPLIALKDQFRSTFGSDELISDISKLLKLNRIPYRNIIHQIQIIVKYMIEFHNFLSNSKLRKRTQSSNWWEIYRQDLMKKSESIVKFMGYRLNSVGYLAQHLVSDFPDEFEELEKSNPDWIISELPGWWRAEWASSADGDATAASRVVNNIKNMWRKYRGKRKLRDGFKNLDEEKMPELRALKI